MTDVDWSLANKTRGVKAILANPRNEKHASFKNVVAIPRSAYLNYRDSTFAAVAAAGAAQADGLALWVICGSDVAPPDWAYVREGLPGERVIAGLACLYSQGWDALSKRLA